VGKKKFIFRFVVAYTYDIDLTEDQIYPNYPWYLETEHVAVPKKNRSKRKLTAAHIRKTVHANGGPGAILRKWNLGPDFIEGAYPTGDLDPDLGTKLIKRSVKLSVRPASQRGVRRRKPHREAGEAG